MAYLFFVLFDTDILLSMMVCFFFLPSLAEVCVAVFEEVHARESRKCGTLKAWPFCCSIVMTFQNLKCLYYYSFISFIPISWAHLIKAENEQHYTRCLSARNITGLSSNTSHLTPTPNLFLEMDLRCAKGTQCFPERGKCTCDNKDRKDVKMLVNAQPPKAGWISKNGRLPFMEGEGPSHAQSICLPPTLVFGERSIFGGATPGSPRRHQQLILRLPVLSGSVHLWHERKI